jgi:hypothetical protein
MDPMELIRSSCECFQEFYVAAPRSRYFSPLKQTRLGLTPECPQSLQEFPVAILSGRRIFRVC